MDTTTSGSKLGGTLASTGWGTLASTGKPEKKQNHLTLQSQGEETKTGREA
jgi:hypothetical protein